MAGRRRRHGLSEDDLAVWRQVARSAQPLHPTRPKPEDKAAPPPAKTERTDAGETNGTQIRPFRIGAAVNGASAGHDLVPDPSSRLATEPVRMDAKAFTRMKRGKLKPERKLDLHGMTMAQAHPALSRFVRRAHADGLRLVVVITGKGRSGADEGGPIPQPRGILRHKVPVWLSAPDMRAMVLQVTDAHIRHGGTGAYYVYLRRAR